MTKARAQGLNWPSGHTVAVISGASDIVVETIAVGQQPVGAALNIATKRLCVTNRLDGTVSVLAI